MNWIEFRQLQFRTVCSSMVIYNHQLTPHRHSTMAVHMRNKYNVKLKSIECPKKLFFSYLRRWFPCQSIRKFKRNCSKCLGVFKIQVCGGLLYKSRKDISHVKYRNTLAVHGSLEHDDARNNLRSSQLPAFHFNFSVTVISQKLALASHVPSTHPVANFVG